jgi:hypothetical protein
VSTHEALTATWTHGCCTDNACTRETCMALPAGKTCAVCLHYHRCRWLIRISGRETWCDWFPRRFYEAVIQPGPVTEGGSP